MKRLILIVIFLISGCASVEVTRDNTGTFTWHSRTLFKDIQQVESVAHGEYGPFEFEMGRSTMQWTPEQMQAVLCFINSRNC